MPEMPTLMASNYCSNTIDAASWGSSEQWGALGNVAAAERAQAIHRRIPEMQFIEKIKVETNMSAARIVKVFIADPNDNIELDKRILHIGHEKLTDLTDQELFFEVPIAEMLAKHNAVRLKTIDKAQAAKFGRDIFLEAAKIRDLKMVVVTIATF